MEWIIIFVDGAEIYKFKAKDSEINTAPLCLANVSKYFSVNSMKRLDYRSGWLW